MAMTPLRTINLHSMIRSEDSLYRSGITRAEATYRDELLRTRERIASAAICVIVAVESLLQTATYIDLGKYSEENKPLARYLVLSEPTRAKIEEVYIKYKLENIKADRLPAFRIVTDIETKAFYDTKAPDGVTDILERHNNAYSVWRQINDGRENIVYEYNFGYMDAFYRALRDTLYTLADSTVRYIGT